MSLVKPKIIYILGAGRSGTTLVDIILGNAEGLLSCGELNRYGKRNGVPGGEDFGISRLNYWDDIKHSMLELGGPDVLIRMKQYSDIFEHHKGFLKSLIFGKGRLFNDYARLNELLLSIISEQNAGKQLIDSSKYPGRLFWLSFLNYDIKIVYVRRDPVDVVDSFQKKEIKQPPKPWLLASVYCAFISFLSRWVINKILNKHKCYELNYADLINTPSECLQELSLEIGVDMGAVIDVIREKRSLIVGNLFEGNRIRYKEELKLIEASGNRKNKFRDKIVRLINAPFYKSFSRH
jgi:hypothetical protein